jgi:hypothetical protein
MLEHRDQVGIGLSLKTRKPVSTGWVLPSSVTSTVLVWPPRGAGLEEVTSWSAAQQPGAGQPGNAGADDGDALFVHGYLFVGRFTD